MRKIGSDFLHCAVILHLVLSVISLFFTLSIIEKSTWVLGFVIHGSDNRQARETTISSEGSKSKFDHIIVSSTNMHSLRNVTLLDGFCQGVLTGIPLLFSPTDT